MTIFLTADTHFGHKATLKPEHCNRPFVDVAAMNEAMVARWNAKVKPNDLVYHLGDVAMWKPAELAIVRRLNGYIHLLPGNHDGFPQQLYLEAGFRSIISMKEFGGDGKGRGELVCTHMPVHPMCLHSPGGWETNVHGHIHGAKVMRKVDVVDERYLCISVEHTDYAPVSLEEVRVLVRLQRERNVMANVRVSVAPCPRCNFHYPTNVDVCPNCKDWPELLGYGHGV